MAHISLLHHHPGHKQTRKMSINGALVDPVTGEPLALSAAETILFSHECVALHIAAGSGFPGDSLEVDQPTGSLFITTHRLVFVGVEHAQVNRSTTAFSSFSVHVDDVHAAPRNVQLVFACQVQGQQATVCLTFPSPSDPQAALEALLRVHGGDKQ